jgi:hypothetical protein
MATSPHRLATRPIDTFTVHQYVKLLSTLRLWLLTDENELKKGETTDDAGKDLSP